jgi:hypothetical protein
MRQEVDLSREPSRLFLLPVLAAHDGKTLSERLGRWSSNLSLLTREVEDSRTAIDEICFDAYGISTDDRVALENVAGKRLAAIPPVFGLQEEVASLLSWAVGVVFGRFDVRLAMGCAPAFRLSDPFAPVPRFSPGVLPSGGVPSDYPVRVDGDGILVNDKGHSDDIVSRVRDVLGRVFGDSDGTLEREACEALRVQSLRAYFQKEGVWGFWESHCTRYGKRGRRAPIYWLLQSPRGLYQAWLYIHRMDRDTLFKLLGPNYLGGKMARVRQELTELCPGGTLRPGASKKEEVRVEELETLLLDLEDFAAKLKAITECKDDRGAIVGWRPDLDDGVGLCAAPLYEVMPWPVKKKVHGKPASELALYWEDLREGKYDWAKLAMLYWPDRVIGKCRANKSLAIAHDLDREFFPGLRDELRRQAERTASVAEDEADEPEDADETGDEEDEE